jgi:hypothetical protein
MSSGIASSTKWPTAEATMKLLVLVVVAFVRQFAESARLEAEIRKNLKGLGT